MKEKKNINLNQKFFKKKKVKNNNNKILKQFKNYQEYKKFKKMEALRKKMPKMAFHLHSNKKLKQGIFLKAPHFNSIKYPFRLNLKLISEFLKKK